VTALVLGAVVHVLGVVAHVLLVAAGAPLVLGVLRLAKARLAGRRGADAWQPYRDLRKLLHKEAVVSPTTSWIFRATPYVLVAVMLAATLLVPVVAVRPPLAFAGGIIMLMSLLLLGTFFLALAGLDAGSAFGGMGASREMAVAALAEPTVILAVFALAMRVGSTNLGGIVERLGTDPRLVLNPGHLLAFAAFFIVLIAETGRLPVDNPATHLELTMIHEAMLLEYSGRYLALVEWAAAMKLTLFLTLLANLFFPWGLAPATTPGALLLGLAVLAAKLGALTVFLGALETAVAKLRLFRVPELLAGSFALALLSVTAVFFLR
jgi:formate hydrogenlyase subunit 4